MNIVVTQQKLKGDWLQIRIREEVKQEFAIAADLRGASMSGLILQFIMKTIREEKAMSPQSFPQSLRKANAASSNIVAHIGPARIGRTR
jgi:antitoxin component of RelBE/YafQ-DinJ toxin-antitoxin module